MTTNDTMGIKDEQRYPYWVGYLEATMESVVRVLSGGDQDWRKEDAIRYATDCLSSLAAARKEGLR